MAVIPPEVVKEDGDFTRSPETQVAAGVGGSTKISRYVIMIPYFVISLGIKVLPTYPTDFCVCEVPIIQGGHDESFLVEVELHGILGELEHTVQEPIRTVLPEMGLIFPVVLGETTYYIIPN